MTSICEMLINWMHPLGCPHHIWLRTLEADLQPQTWIDFSVEIRPGSSTWKHLMENLHSSQGNGHVTDDDKMMTISNSLCSQAPNSVERRHNIYACKSSKTKPIQTEIAVFQFQPETEMNQNGVFWGKAN